MLPPGSSVGDYVIESRVSHGGMGTVYRAVRGGKRFALKINSNRPQDLPEEHRKDLDERMLREVGTLASLSHPNVLKIRGFDRWPDADTGYLYLVTELVEGDRLYVWQERTRPSFRAIVNVFLRIADGLHEMHRHNIFHRGLKQENLLVRANGEPMIIDFGIARLASAYTLTGFGTILGTARYFSPQYCRSILTGHWLKGDSRYQYTPYDDVHALGFMLYEMVTGRMPFELVDEDDDLGLYEFIAHKVLERPTVVNSEVPEALERIVMRLLEREPKDAFESAQALSEALAAALAGAEGSWDVVCARASRLQSLPKPNPRPTVDDRAAREGGKAAGPHAPPPRPPQQPSAGFAALMLQEADVGAQGPIPFVAQPPVELLDTTVKNGFRPPVKEAAKFEPPEASVSPAERKNEPTRHDPTSDQIRSAQAELASGRVGGWKARLPWVVVGGALFALAVAVTGLPRGQEVGAAGSQVSSPMPPLVETAARTDIAAGPGAAPSSASGRDLSSGPIISEKSALDVLTEPTPVKKPSSTKATGNTAAPAEKEWPSWLVRAQPLSKPKPASSEPKKLGVPYGAHLRAKLRSNLDSRTIDSGVVEAVLSKAFYVDGEPVLPAGTLLYGRASTNHDRFNIQFTKARLPEGNDFAVNAYAIDLIDGKPGLQASRRVSSGGSTRPETGERVASSAANTLMTKGAGTTVGELANAAKGSGMIDALRGEEAQGSSAQTLALVRGAESELFVQESF